MHASRLHALVLRILLVAGATAGLHAQDPPREPPLRRWVDVQSFTIYGRYRVVENSADVTTSNHVQYKDTFRGRFNFDPRKRYTITLGGFSGSNFIGSWNNSGVGTGDFDGKDHHIKQLYASATPIPGLELQYGGIYVTRGESDEFTSYDDDGYIVGERVSLRRPQIVYLDELSITRGAIGPFGQPNVMKRWDGLTHPNYAQVLGAKRFSEVVAASLDYSTQAGADTIRAAVTLQLRKSAPMRTIRYEQYRRVTMHPAAGFAIWGERSITKYARLQAGYVTIDQFYGGFNADRIQTGRRFFAIGTIPIHGPLAVSLYATHALSAPYPMPLKRRFDAVISYDVLAALRRTGQF